MLIQKLRLQKGWSQQQLADLSGLSVRTIQRIEQGQVASPESLKSLAAVFEIPFSDLKESAMSATETAPAPLPAADNADADSGGAANNFSKEPNTVRFDDLFGIVEPR